MPQDSPERAASLSRLLIRIKIEQLRRYLREARSRADGVNTDAEAEMLRRLLMQEQLAGGSSAVLLPLLPLVATDELYADAVPGTPGRRTTGEALSRNLFAESTGTPGRSPSRSSDDIESRG